MNALQRAASKLHQTLLHSRKKKELGFLHPDNQDWAGVKDSQTKRPEMPGSHRIVRRIKENSMHSIGQYASSFSDS